MSERAVNLLLLGGLVLIVGLACWLSPKLALVGLLTVMFWVVG